MAVFTRRCRQFAKMQPEVQTPTFSTIAMGAVSIVLYVP